MKNLKEIKELLETHYPNRTPKSPIHLRDLSSDEVVRGYVNPEGDILDTKMKKIGVWAEFTIVPAPEKPKVKKENLDLTNATVREAFDFERKFGEVAVINCDQGDFYAKGRVGYALLSVTEDGVGIGNITVKGKDIIAFNTPAPSKKETSVTETTTPDTTEENSEVLVWFKKKKKSRYSRNDVKVDAVPDTAVKLDSKKHRYQVERGTIYKYAAQKSGGYMKQNFGNASFAPAAVIAALQQLQGQGRVSVSD